MEHTILQISSVVSMACVFPVSVAAQTLTVQGIVKDAKGEPIIGASVMQKGSKQGTISDMDGKFKLKTSPNATLVFSYIGCKTEEVQVEGRTTISIILQENAANLDELVVVGYGTMKKSDVTGSVSNLGEATLKQVPVSNISQSMQGRIAGVSIQQTSTRPGQGSQIRIRGTRSLTASNDPLIIVDGIPFGGSFNDIAPDDIKQVDILKDASATAIYGSRGANGVILITTNRGKKDHTAVSYNGYAGLGTVSRKYRVFNASEFMDYKRQPGNGETWPLLEQEQAGLDKGQNTDWQDLMYRTAMVQSHDLSVSGGVNMLSVGLGLGYYKETAVIPEQDFTRYSLRFNVDFKPKSWLKIGLNSQNAFGITNGENVSPLYQMLATSPLVDPYNEDGTIRKQPHYPREDSYNVLLYKNEDWKQERKRFNTLNSLYGEIQFTSWLKWRTNIGLNYTHEDYGDFYASESFFKVGGLSSASTSYTTSYNYAVENLLYFDYTIKNKHHIGATLMQSVEDSYYRYSSVGAQNMVADYMYYYNLGMSSGGITVNPKNQNYFRKVLLSYMGRVNYSFDSRYMATLTFRSDGSSVLSDGHKWHSYPAVALAWNIKNEKFMKHVNWLDQLKLRLGYGETSNQAVNPYSTWGKLSQNKYNFGTNYVYGYYMTSLANQNVGWEYTRSYNIGLDWSILNGRINGSFDAYLQKTRDLLLSQNLPSSSGVGGSILVNAGRTQNKGFEMVIHSHNFVGKKRGDFTWDTDINFSLNRNKLEALTSGVTKDEGNGWFVGSPIDVIYDYKKIGIWQKSEAEEAAKYGSEPGEIKIEDYNKDGKIDANDRYVTNKLEPTFSFGFTNHFTYKNFDMDVVTYGQVGGTLVSSLYQGQSYLNRLDGRRNQLKVNYWTETNPTNDFPKVSQNHNYTYFSTLGYFNASYWKIQTITLGYTFPESWTKKMHISNLRVYFSCNNVATLFSPYMNKVDGVDALATGYYAHENGGGSQPTRQLNVGLNTPPARQFLFGINFKL